MAFAAVISLKNIIERLINPTNPKILRSVSKELKSLCYTLEKLDDSRRIDRSKINGLDAKIRVAIYNLEDLLQSYALNVAPFEYNDVEQEIDSVLTKLKKLKSNYNEVLDCPLFQEEDVHVVSPIDVSAPNKSTTVGLSDDFRRIRNQLLDGELGLGTVSLIGMAGIGKTHLALEVYQDPVIVQEFELRAWVSIGQKDQTKKVLADIVSQIQSRPINKCMKKSKLRLKKILETSLCDRKYLIVLDDMWNTEAYAYLLRCLPESTKGERIVLTTRLEKVAKYYCTYLHRMCFLNTEESWNLLGQNMFGDHSLSLSLYRQIERVGRKIAEKCEGLPLLILAVANILRGHEMTEEYWNKVANNKTNTFPDAYDQISKVLSSSYDDLPQHLKFCFLYMGVFPQSCEIPLRKLVSLWTFEDFLEPKKLETLEDFSLHCVECIVSKSLAIVCTYSSSFRIKSFRLHSAYWHLCVKEARKTKFFHVIKDLTNTSLEDTISQRRFSVQNNVLLGMEVVYDSMAAASTTRSLLCTGLDHEYPVPMCFEFTLLKVLDALAIRFYDFPNQVLKLVQLRYLGLTHNGELPSSISRLDQVEYLILRQHHNIKILRDSTCLPKEIWDMKELRHLRIMGSKLPDPSHGVDLPNLSTLYVNAKSCTEDIFRSIPHLKKLAIKIELQPEAADTFSCFQHIGLLRELRSLKCVVANPWLGPRVRSPLTKFPKHLKKLCLNGVGFPWKRVSSIGSLPYLEVLKLKCYAFQGPEWNTEGREFRRLRYLLLEDNDLVQWTTKGNCFRSLQRLIIQRCFKLKEIPSVIGGLCTLKTMEVIDCSSSLVASVHKMEEDSDSSVQVVIINHHGAMFE